MNPPPAPLPISVVVVARNEAAHLPRCLASVQGWVSEIVVALNETTDGSAAVAEAAGASVRTVPWLGFRDTKNAAMEFARWPWALFLDADEEVSAELRDDLEHFLGSDEPGGFAGARFPRKVWFIDRWILHGDWYPDYVVRLVRIGRGRWGGDPFVHERLVCDGPVATLRGELLHHSFPTLSSHVAKITPYADLFVRRRIDAGQRFSAAEAVARPAWRFVRAYFIKRGFLDGFPGFYIAWATAFGSLVRYSRLYEAECQAPPPVR
ncbi:MAG: glycosyltransferase family 2 protein [Opitutaceae bacterium]